MLAQHLTQHWGELRFSLSDRFVREDYPPLKEHFREIAQAQFVAHAPQHHETHDVSGVLQVIEPCPGALVELPVTRAAAEAPVA
jgi:hypothetical protein